LESIAEVETAITALYAGESFRGHLGPLLCRSLTIASSLLLAHSIFYKNTMEKSRWVRLSGNKVELLGYTFISSTFHLMSPLEIPPTLLRLILV